MTQLDLPQVSFARYLDLLKRRRWQVVPISLIGLVIGAIVALSIPRYFVAQMQVRLEGKLLDLDSGDDPLRPIMESVGVTLLDTVPLVLEKLGWEEYLVDDPSAQRAYETKIRSRVAWNDLNAGANRRSQAVLHITYKDEDRQRATTFLNALVETWVENEQKSLLSRAQAKINRITTRMKANQESARQSQVNLKEYEAQFDLNPQSWQDGTSGPVLNAQTAALLRAQSQVRTLRPQIKRLREQLNEAKDRRDAVPRTITATPPPPPGSEAALQIIAQFEMQLLMLRRKKIGIRPSHQEYEATEKQIERLSAQQAEIKKTLGVGEPVKGQNDAWIERDRQYREAKRNHELAVEQLEAAEQAALDAAADIAKLRQIAPNYRELRLQLDALQSAKLELQGLLSEAQQFRDDLQLTKAFAPKGGGAWAPETATDPNPWLMGLIGSVLGLGLAIALILALDVLQSTFKTVDDVERGLAVPVLGSMAFLETDEQRVEAGRRRRRVVFAAAAFLILSLSLITIYYVSPARLPTGVRDVLQMLLGDLPKKS